MDWNQGHSLPGDINPILHQHHITPNIGNEKTLLMSLHIKTRLGNLYYTLNIKIQNYPVSVQYSSTLKYIQVSIDGSFEIMAPLSDSRGFRCLPSTRDRTTLGQGNKAKEEIEMACPDM